MLNIKNCFFSYAKTYKKALNYDAHEYKEQRLKKVDKKNVELVNNVALFEAELQAYKEDLKASYKAERYKKFKKTNKEIEKIFNTSKVMRSFRISCNHIELNMLHKPNDNEEQKRQNIINFYTDVLNQFQTLLNQNNKFGKEVQIVKADLHFDQTSPHLHIHVSNLYEREVKKLNRKNVNTCNVLVSDAIRFLNQKKKDIYKSKGINLTPNEIFAHSLREQNKDYAIINKIDLKKLFPKEYNIFKLMSDADIIEKDWRLNKERYFRVTKANLAKLGLEIDKENDITNTQKLNDLSYYCFIQSLFKELTKDLDQEQNQLNIKKISDILNDNEQIAKLLDESNEVFNLEQSLNKVNLNLVRLNYKKESLNEQFANSLKENNSKNANENKELVNSLEKINSLIVKNNLDKQSIAEELEHQKFLNKNSDLMKNFINPSNLTQDKSLNGIGLNLAYFKPELNNIEQELINSLFLSKNYEMKNRLDYVSQISLASTNPLTKLDLHIINNNSEIQTNSSNKTQHFNKLGNQNNTDDDYLEDLSQSYNTNQTFKKNRSLKDIEQEELEMLKKKRSNKR